MIKGLWYCHSRDTFIEVRWKFWKIIIAKSDTGWDFLLDTDELKGWFERNTIFLGEI